MALALAALGIVTLLLPTDLPRAASQALARLRGYDGCTCPDCGQTFGFIGDIDSWICGTARARMFARAESRRHTLAAFSWTGAGLLLASALRRPRAPVGYCQHCGYDLAGCVLDRCPECGWERVAEES